MVELLCSLPEELIDNHSISSDSKNALLTEFCRACLNLMSKSPSNVNEEEIDALLSLRQSLLAAVDKTDHF